MELPTLAELEAMHPDEHLVLSRGEYVYLVPASLLAGEMRRRSQELEAPHIAED
jgi:hypothetical protein